MNYLTSKEFADKIGMNVRTVRRWDKDGRFLARRTATQKVFYTQDDVERYFRTAEVSHDGRWICVDGYKSKCSVCGAVYEYDDNFCGSCGARMVWDKDEKERLARDKDVLK